MPKNNKKTSISLFSLHVPVFIVGALVLVGAFASSYTVVSSSVLGNNDKNNSSKVKAQKDTSGKSDKSNNARDNSQKDKGNSQNIQKDFEEKENSQNSASENSSKSTENLSKKEKTELSIGQLKKTSNELEEQGNLEVSQELDEASIEIADIQVEVEETVEEIESRPKWQTVLFGTDYKNLGQLRSHLVRTQNTIRKLERNSQKVAGTDSALVIQEQIQLLEQEEAQIRSVIQEKESEFSVLGWVVKLFSGYTSEPVGGMDPDFDETAESTESTESVDMETEPSSEL